MSEHLPGSEKSSEMPDWAKKCVPRMTCIVLLSRGTYNVTLVVPFIVTKEPLANSNLSKDNGCRLDLTEFGKRLYKL